MRSLILAAGQGTRMGRYCAGRPKGMLPFLDKPLIEWQLRSLRRAGLSDISIVTGYAADTIRFPDVRLFHNSRFASTNMVMSLLTAAELFDEPLIVSYGDILFESGIIEKLMRSPAEVAVAGDSDWRDLWNFRFGTISDDLESFKVQGERVVELGRPCNDPDEQELRYIGLIRFSPVALQTILAHVARKERGGAIWNPSGKPFLQGYMTDLLCELIGLGTEVGAVKTERGWLEFDTELDYERQTELATAGGLGRFIDLGR